MKSQGEQKEETDDGKITGSDNLWDASAEMH